MYKVQITRASISENHERTEEIARMVGGCEETVFANLNTYCATRIEEFIADGDAIIFVEDPDAGLMPSKKDVTQEFMRRLLVAVDFHSPDDSFYFAGVKLLDIEVEEWVLIEHIPDR